MKIQVMMVCLLLVCGGLSACGEEECGESKVMTATGTLVVESDDPADTCVGEAAILPPPAELGTTYTYERSEYGYAHHGTNTPVEGGDAGYVYFRFTASMAPIGDGCGDFNDQLVLHGSLVAGRTYTFTSDYGKDGTASHNFECDEPYGSAVLVSLKPLEVELKDVCYLDGDVERTVSGTVTFSGAPNCL